MTSAVVSGVGVEARSPRRAAAIAIDSRARRAGLGQPLAACRGETQGQLAQAVAGRDNRRSRWVAAPRVPPSWIDAVMRHRDRSARDAMHAVHRLGRAPRNSPCRLMARRRPDFARLRRSTWVTCRGGRKGASADSVVLAMISGVGERP